MNKKLLIAGIVVLMGLLMSACGDRSPAQNEAAMNTIQPYTLSDQENDLVSLVAPNSENAIAQFSVDKTYKRVCVGYDYYEKGVKKAKNCSESEMTFEYDAGPQDSYGKIYTYIDDDDVVTGLQSKAASLEETNNIGGKSPLSNDNQTLEDMEGITESTLDTSINIEKDKKIYIWAMIGTDNDEFEVADISTLMKDKKLISSYDKCFVFYAIFN